MAKLGKKNPRDTANYVLMTVGTAAASCLQGVQEEMGKFPRLTAEEGFRIHRIAIDTNEIINQLSESGVTTLVIGKEELNGVGSGMDFEAAEKAFMDSKPQFMDLLKSIPNLKGVVVLANPGFGGTATGVLVPLMLAVRDELCLPTMAFVIEPSSYANGCGPLQLSAYENVMRKIKEHEICISLLHADWMFSQQFRNLPIPEARMKILAQISTAVSTLFSFWEPPKRALNNLAALDANDLLKKVLKLGVFVKVVSVQVNLSFRKDEEIRTELERCFREMVEHQLFQMGEAVTYTATTYEGCWIGSYLEIMHSLLKDYAGNNPGYAAKESYESLAGTTAGDSESPDMGKVTMLFACPMPKEVETAQTVQVAPIGQLELSSSTPVRIATTPIVAIPSVYRGVNGRPAGQKITLTPQEVAQKEELLRGGLYKNADNPTLLMVAEAAAVKADASSLKVFSDWRPLDFERIVNTINNGYSLSKERLTVQLWRYLSQKDLIEALQSNQNKHQGDSWLDRLHALLQAEQRDFPGSGKLEFRDGAGRIHKVTPNLQIGYYIAYQTSLRTNTTSEQYRTAEEMYLLKRIFGERFQTLWIPIKDEPKPMTARLGDAATRVGRFLTSPR